MRKKIPPKIYKLLPWYANGTLSVRERWIVEQYLRQNPEMVSEVDAYRQYLLRMKSWEKRSPTPRAYSGALDRIHMPQAQRGRGVHYYAWGAALVIMVLLWLIVRPGVLLEWNGAGGDVNEFYVYRTAATGEFQRIGVVTARGEDNQYTFVDTKLLPWESYTYVVQGVQGDHVRALSDSVQRDALAILPVQVVLLAISLALGYGLAGWLRRFPVQVGGMGAFVS